MKQKYALKNHEDKMIWKTLAIMFGVLFILETLVIISGLIILEQEKEKTMECYYEICEFYPEALYEDNLCTCYDYDVIGELIPSKYEIMK